MAREYSPVVTAILYYSGLGQLPVPLKALINWFQRGGRQLANSVIGE
jgi:hypothetical protein